MRQEVVALPGQEVKVYFLFWWLKETLMIPEIVFGFFSGRQLFVWCKCDALEEVGELNGWTVT